MSLARIASSAVSFFVIICLCCGQPLLASAAESGDSAAGSAAYYQQELDAFGKGADHVGASGAMTFRYPMGAVTALYSSDVGWRIATHSEIARSTLWGVPTYTDDDIFTLDGEELVRQTATDAGPVCLGATTWVYHTRHESYRRILYCKPGEADSYWQIFDQDGSISFYGTTADTRIAPNAPEQPAAWAIAKQERRSALATTTYRYSRDADPANSAYYLDTIVSGKLGAAPDGYTAVRLDYNPVSLPVSYRSGVKYQPTRQVTSVTNVIGCDQTGAGGETVDGYTIGWDLSPQTATPRVTAITRTGRNGAALPPTKFDYQTYAGGFEETPVSWQGDTTAYTLRSVKVTEEEADEEEPDSEQQQLTCNDFADGLVACYPFDGDAKDEIGRNDGEVKEGVVSTTNRFGKPNSAYYFPGGYDQNKNYIVIPHRDSIAFPEEFSLNFWMSPQYNSWIHKVICKDTHPGQNYGVNLWGDLSGTGLQQYLVDVYNPVGNVAYYNFKENEWVHVVYTREQAATKTIYHTKIYINGTLYKESTEDLGVNYAVRMNQGPLFIGYDGWYRYPTYRGKLDDLRLYNRALTPEEVQALASDTADPDAGPDTATEADLIDINSDGLPDRVEADQARLSIRANTGSGFDSPVSMPLPTDDDSIRSSRDGETTVDLIDMNGDGQADRVVKTTAGDTLQVYLSKTVTTPFDTPGFESFATAWRGDSEESRIRTVQTTEHSQATVSDLLDMNGDGLPDRVESDGTSLTIRLNDGAKFREPEVWDLPDSAHALRYVELSETASHTIADLMDMNGDGLPDRVVKTGGGALTVFLNTGSGFADAVTWGGDTPDCRVRSSSVSGAGTTNQQIVQADLMDVNGDGLPDRVANGEANGLDVRLNTGSGFGAPQVWNLPESGYVRFKTVSDTQHDLMDMTGDGVIDRVIKISGSAAFTVYPGKVTAGSDILIGKVTNPLGGSASYAYMPIPKTKEVFSQTNPYYRPKRFVVSSVTTDNGLGQRETSTYAYFNGRYDAARREDWGFGRVIMTDATGAETERHYYQDELRAGLLKKEITRAASPVTPGTGAIFNYTYHNYANLATFPHYGSGVSQPRPMAGAALTVVSVKPIALDSYLVDGATATDGLFHAPECSSCPRSRTEWSYSDYGQPTLETQYGDYGSGGDRSQTDTTTAYGVNLTTWMFLPATVTTHAFDASGAYAVSGHTGYGYDDGSIGGIATGKGLLTAVETSTAPGKRATTRTVYDSYGNPLRVIAPNGNQTNYLYDGRFHAYPHTETAPQIGSLTFSTRTTYDTLMRPHIVTDPNGKTTTTGYDHFNRVTSVIAPGSEVSYDFAQDGTAPEFVRVTTKDGPEVVTCVDGFGQTIQTKTRAANQQNAPRWRTVDQWQYVENGARVTEVSEPYFSKSDACDRAMTPQQSQKSRSVTTERLDPVRGRVSDTTDFAGTRSSVAVKFYVTTATDAAQHVTVTTVNPAAQTTTITDALNGLTTTVRSFDREQISDADGIVTTRWFDWAGRLTQLNDPDLGVRTYTYDDNGNLLTLTDAKQQTIAYAYDAHDRLTLTDYPTGTDTRYFYDGDDEGDGKINRAGMKGLRGRVTDASGSTTWDYDDSYHMTKETKTIDDKTAVTGFGYNAYQLNAIQYPGDSAWTQYAFDEGRDVVTLTAPGQPIVTAARYTAFDTLATLTYGNGDVTTYDYFAATGNFRLRQATARRANKAVLLQRAYTYDALGNIMTIDDAESAGDQAFLYDALSRLIAQTNNGFAGGAESFAYTPSGNLLRNNGAAYAYQDGTHRVVSVTKQSATTAYTYDANGNMRTRGGVTLEYDADNRLIALSSGERFAYDFSGRRVKKIEPCSTTYYFNAYYEEDVACTNAAPAVNAGADQTIVFPATAVTLSATTTDDGLPAAPGAVTVSWSKVRGPGDVIFGNAAAATTTATVTQPGTYVLRATANDGCAEGTDDVKLTVRPSTQNTLVVVTVKDPENRPDVNVLVRAFQNGTMVSGIGGRTNAAGQIVLTLPAGAYRLKATKNGTDFWSGATDHCVVPGCSNAVITTTVPITISVHDTTGVPDVDVPVYVFSGGSSIPGGGRTDANGQVTVTLPFGQYRFRTSKHGTSFWSGATDHCVVPGCVNAVILTSVPVVVTVKESLGVPDEDVPVYVFSGGSSIPGGGRTDANGQVTVTLPFGQYRFRTSKHGTSFWSGDSDHCVVPGCVNASILTSVPVVVTVKDRRGAPDVDVPVAVFSDGRSTGKGGRTDANGQVVLTLPFGQYRFRTSKHGVSYWSGDTDHCAVPGCTEAAITTSAAAASAARSATHLLSAAADALTAQPVVQEAAALWEDARDWHAHGLATPLVRAQGNALIFTFADSAAVNYGQGDFTVTVALGADGEHTLTVTRQGERGLIAVDGHVRDTQPLGATPVGLRLTLTDPALLPLTLSSVCAEPVEASAAEPDAVRAETDLPLLGGARGGFFAARASGELLTTTYYYVNGLRVAQNRNGVWTWIHSDHLHSATVIADKDGNVVRRLAYKPFGEEVINAGTGEKPPYTYTGKELDSSGLMYYGARYYDPALARFITPDTVYDAGTQGLNRYAYALNHPLKYTDPTGNAVNAAYNNETPYSAFPYVSTVDTGSNLADYALGTLGGAWNLAANVLNSPFNAGGLFEESYNAGTKLVLGQEGFSGGGLAVDSFMWAQMGVPVGAVTQSLQCARTYLRAAAPLSKLKIALASERGAVYIPGKKNSLPIFLQNLFKAGEDFNKANRPRYLYNEIEVFAHGKKFRVDSYVPGKEIISRRLTQFSEIQESTAIGYFNEFIRKYASGVSITESPFNPKVLRGGQLVGDLIFEVPTQNAAVPQSVLDAATTRGITIRDVLGKVYN